jgi:SAM-dependent methyltransferase
MKKNTDAQTVKGFGEEWSWYDQSDLPTAEHHQSFDEYFKVFPWRKLPSRAVGFDLGCGSGRWAKLVAPRVDTLHCIDASEAAVGVARKNLGDLDNCQFHVASIDANPLPDGSMDFGYSLGVLHHVPDTEAGIQSCVAKLKPGAPFLLYIYYAFDNRPFWFRLLWKTSDWFRHWICRLPFWVKVGVTTAIAACVYFPLARLALVLEQFGATVEGMPLSYYRRRSFYTMGTDALDRFGTCLEHRYTKEQIRAMMENAGLEAITFATSQPYWCAVGFKRGDR